MHGFTPETERLAEAVLAYAMDRMKLDPVPMDGPVPFGRARRRRSARRSPPRASAARRCCKLFDDVLSPRLHQHRPSALPLLHPDAPTESASLFDLVVGASSIYGGSWLEGAGAVYAENQALRWIADLAGLPIEAGGVFVQGGTLGNLSALVAARHTVREGRAAAGCSSP